jgi:hypothetical protein
MRNFLNLLQETPNNCMCIFARDLSMYICAYMIGMIFLCWTHMRMFGFNFFGYICGLQCVIYSHVYVISLFTYDTILKFKIIKIYIFNKAR